MATEIFGCAAVNERSSQAALEKIVSIGNCEAVKRHTKRFYLILNTRIEASQDSKAVYALARRLAKVLNGMAGLYRLGIFLTTTKEGLESFRAAFSEAQIQLHSVREIILGANMEWMLSICPNATAVSTYDFWAQFDGHWWDTSSATQ